jgi:signal transduction histidine kinase
MGLLSKSLPAMKKPVSSPQRPDELERLEQYPVKLMQHQEEPAHQLAQKINEIIASSSATEKMLLLIAQVLGLAFEVDCCSLVTSNGEESGEAIIANWCAQDYLIVLPGTEVTSIEEIDLPVVQCASEPLTIGDISTIEDSLVIGCQNLPISIKAVLAIPTRFGGKNNGTISLIKSQPYDWSQKEKQLLKAVESSCAIAFSQVAQAQLLASQEQSLQASVQHQSLIEQLTILSRSNLEISQMLQLAIASTAQALQADRGMLIQLRYADPRDVRVRPKKQIPKARAIVAGEWTRETAKYSIDEPDTEDNSFLISDCNLCQRVFLDPGKAVIIENIDNTETLTAAPVFHLSKLSTVLLLPLENQGRILGFLVLQQASSRHWQAAEISLVELVCAQVSNAIIQTQTLRQVQTLVEERTEQLQRSLEVQAKLYERTKKYVKQLQDLNELKDEFMSNMSDRLRYPLTNMRMAIRNLRQTAITPERQTRYMDILEQECSKEINLINDLLTLQRLETHQERPQFENIDLNPKIQDLASSFEKKLAEKGLTISLDLSQSLTLETEVESFDRIVQELLTNTCKYSERDSTVHLQVSHQVIEQIDRVIIRVTNIGRAISQEEATYIFDKFTRGKGRWTPGTGLGLALVKSLVEHLNGAIAVESSPISEDSELSKICFTLNLPQFSKD